MQEILLTMLILQMGLLQALLYKLILLSQWAN